MTRDQRQMAVAFFLAVTARILFHYSTGFVIDDAFITFRYAENIALGHGFVYNLGERVLGTTTPLFTLILSLFATAGISVYKASLGVSLLCSGLTAIVVLRFAQSLRFTLWCWVPVLLYALFPRSLPMETGGMETALFTLLVTSGIYYHHRGLHFYAMAAATLASVTRPEGLWLLGLLFIWWVARKPRTLIRLIVIPITLMGPWVLFAWQYFGSPVPNSVAAKLALYSHYGTAGPLQNLSFLLGLHNPFGWVMLALAIPGTWWLFKKQNFGRLAVAWILGMIAFYSFNQSHIFLWYIVPIYPVYAVLVGACFPWLSERLAWSRGRAEVASKVALVVLTLALGLGNITPLRYYSQYQELLEQVHQSVGYYLRAHAKEGEVVASEDIGYIGYYSGMELIDRDGLISPEVVPYNRAGDYYGVIRHFEPEWVVAAKGSATSGFIDSASFLEDYHMQKSFMYPTGIDLRVYRRTVGGVGEAGKAGTDSGGGEMGLEGPVER
jgi:hypothetical protein